MSTIRRLFQLVTHLGTPSTTGLHGPAELEQAIRRERSRADRTGGQFAAISYFAGNGRWDQRSLSPLANYLKQRIRSIDDLGWCRENKLWLILADCTEEAAANLATEHCRAVSTAELPLCFTLYHYSADKSPLDQGPSAPKSAGVEATHRNVPVCVTYPAITETEHAVPMEELLTRGMPWWKRAFDIAGAAAGLILLSPLLAVIALAVRLSSPGPVVFTQLRSGRGGRPFLLYKFRSMVVDAESHKQTLLSLNEQDGPAFKMERDPRVTKLGRTLRAFSLDELPQLWNVLRGDMSLVGPRPLPIAEAEACVGWQRQRTDVTPGLTCFWQVKDRRAKIPFVDWARMDIQYIRGRSLIVDLRLMLQTLLFVIRRKGV